VLSGLWILISERVTCSLGDLLVDTDKFAYLSLETLENFIYDVMVGVGVPKNDSRLVADVLVASDKRGIDSHGIARLKMYYDRIKRGQQLPTTKLTIERETPAIALINANNGMGQVAAKKAMELAPSQGSVSCFRFPLRQGWIFHVTQSLFREF